MQLTLNIYGELRVQGAGHDAIAKDALTRLEVSEARERKHLRDLGSTRARIAELEAHIAQRPALAVVRAHRSTRKREPPPEKPRRFRRPATLIKIKPRRATISAKASLKRGRPQLPARKRFQQKRRR
jgi:hypothetical protein